MLSLISSSRSLPGWVVSGVVDLEVGLIMLSLKASQRLEIFLERRGTHIGHLFPVLSKHVSWKVWKQFNLTAPVIEFCEHSA